MPAGLSIEKRDGVNVVRMEFGRANALGPEVVERLAAGLAAAGPEPAVLVGEGKIFCAGLDLVSLDSLDRGAFVAFVDRFSALMVQVLTSRRPMVAAINGHAVAGGCVLALACDYRVGTAGDFKIGMNELAIGLSLPAVALEIPRAALTPRALRRVILDAELLDPASALELGVLDEVADDADAALERASEEARKLGRHPEAFAGVKGGVTMPVAEAIRAKREGMDHRFADMWFSEQARQMRQQAVARLKEKKG